ncbi:MAG TPA: DUF1475 family protein [Roseimicrobium sp.]|nr:DUF1475 family protein [Roseimicrobium sp.]
MIAYLRIHAVVVLLAMLAVTGWASSEVALWKMPGEVVRHPWFIATLFDAYFGFLIFYAWLFYKETALAARVGWFVAIMLLGNIAMAVYLLLSLRRLPGNARIEDLLLRRAQDPKGGA